MGVADINYATGLLYLYLYADCFREFVLLEKCPVTSVMYMYLLELSLV